MAKKLVVDLNFSGVNHLYLVENTNIYPMRIGLLDDIKFSIYEALRDNKDIHNIVLLGKNNYSEGIREELLKDVVTKYFNGKVRIDIDDQIFN